MNKQLVYRLYCEEGLGLRLTGDDVVRVLEQVTNGPEFISRSLDLWADCNGVKLDEARAVTEAWKDYNRVRPHRGQVTLPCRGRGPFLSGAI